MENKKNEIQAIVNKYHPHILGLSEANFHSYHDRDKVQLPDYTLHTCPTLDNPELKVSRVVVYTHSSLVVKLRPDLMDHSISSIWMEIGLPGRSKILTGNDNTLVRRTAPPELWLLSLPDGSYFYSNGSWP